MGEANIDVRKELVLYGHSCTTGSNNTTFEILHSLSDICVPHNDTKLEFFFYLSDSLHTTQKKIFVDTELECLHSL